MLTNKQTKMLELLGKQMSKCKDCGLFVNGRSMPYWSTKSKYLMISESPNGTDIKDNNIFWDFMANNQLTKQDFIILNSVNCKIMNDGKPCKPSEYHREVCHNWTRKYIKTVKPEKILVMGNFAINSLTGEWGIGKFYKDNKLLSKHVLYGINTSIIRMYNPSVLLFDKSKETQLQKSIKLLKE